MDIHMVYEGRAKPNQFQRMTWYFSMRKYVKKFGGMNKGDIQEAGGKAAILGELTQNGLSVPPGFCGQGNFSYLD
jgi:hypothetical protein